MNSLSTRLLAAFSLLIVVVVAGVGVALLLLLRNTPIAERQTLTRLNDAARVALSQDSPLAGASPAELEGYVARAADVFAVRVIVTTPNGRTLADSHGAAEEPINFRNFRAARPEPAAAEGFTGRIRDEQRQLWLYTARPVGARLLIFAAQQPRFAALLFFGDDLLSPLVQAGAIAALLSVVLAALISRSIARPLNKMASVAQGIARGDYSQTAPASGPDEVRALGQSLNSMSQQVRATQQAQRDFLANVSHELKTPLTSIQGFSQALLDGTAASPEAIRRSAGIIHDEAERMRHLVGDLLDLAKLDAGLNALNRAPLDVRPLLLGQVEKFSLRAQEKGVSLQSDLPPALPTLQADADRLTQVLTNLLDNALKHTPAGGRVTLAAAPDRGGLLIRVSDTGPGIPAEDLPRIFERFYQVDKSRARSAGVGLGLAITKEIVAAHKGTLSVDSQVGAGSTFSVWLPLALPDDTTVARKR